jgi:hypothetical protein
MDAAFVLVHSLAVGPATWAPVAARLRTGGAVVVVPSLLDVADGQPPFWPRIVELVAGAVADLAPEQPVLIAGHSNAGLFLPAIVQASPRPVAGCLFVDATLPSRAATTPAATPERLEVLARMVVGDRLPPWTAWWDEADVAPMFPDPGTRAAVEAEQPRLPLAYYQQHVPVPPGWDARPCGYLLFSPPYRQAAGDARERGWQVTEIPGLHLHQLVDPQAVARHLRATRRQWTR